MDALSGLNRFGIDSARIALNGAGGQMSQKTKTMLGGFTALGVAGLICKVIGMVFRVSLSAQIGSQGIGLYQAVYPTYNLLLTLSSAGLPVAISRMVAEAETRGDERGASRVLHTALALLGGAGLLLALVMALGSGFLAERIGAADARVGFLMIAPSVLIVSVMSAYRGYMQGHRAMTPTAISQLIEQVGKVVISFPLSVLGLRTSVVHAAAGALLGITISEALALLYMLIVASASRRKYLTNAPRHAAQPEGGAGGHAPLWLAMLRIAVPITLGAAIVPLVGTIDSAMILNRLQSAGFTAENARSLYGLQSGSVLSLLNVPTALAIAVAMSIVPTISAARERGDRTEVGEQTALSLRLSILVGLPCALGMWLLSTPIVALLYPRYPLEEIQIAGRLLSIGAFTIPLFILVQATTGVLQGMGAQQIPMITLLVGAAAKAVLNYTLIGAQSINIYGAPIASVVCYTISAGINIYYVFRKTDVSFKWGLMLIRPAVATAVMAAAVLAAIRFIGTGSGMKTLLCVFVGILAYIVAAPLAGAVRREDLAQFPGGSRIAGKFRLPGLKRKAP